MRVAKQAVLLFFLAFFLALAACRRNGEDYYVDAFSEPVIGPLPIPWVRPPDVPDEEEPDDEPDDEPDADEDEICTLPRSVLTGLVVDEEVVNRRPLAIVINNLHTALPQSGITSADVIYEVLAEGDVSRLVGIFQTEWPEKIGPVRSARDYLVDFALNHDAIFVHHGESTNSPLRYPYLQGARLDGMRLEGRVYWRDRNYPAWWTRSTGQRALEHSSYVGGARVEAHLEGSDIRTITDGSAGFYFHAEPREGGEGEALRFTVPFSRSYIRTFIYDPETGLYNVENRDGPTLDELNREQVVVRNVLVMLTQVRLIPGDYAGRREVATVGNGDGFLFNNGEYRPVRWEKESHDAPLRWYNPDGTPLVLLPGATWINVLQNTAEVRFDS